jgi:hypothetical protein
MGEVLCKQSSYVANGEVLKANKHETVSENQSKEFC